MLLEGTFVSNLSFSSIYGPYQDVVTRVWSFQNIFYVLTSSSTALVVKPVRAPAVQGLKKSVECIQI